MSWDILPKANLQYFLSKLKDIFDQKVDKVSGKGLSTNDYTTTEKNKLSGIASGAEVNVQSDWSVTNTSSDAFIKNKPTIPTVYNSAFYGKCESNGDAATKVVDLVDATGWQLRRGVIVSVWFKNKNTAGSSAAPVTLNVNGSGNIEIFFNTGRYTGSNEFITGSENRIIHYMYNGAYWVFINISNNYRDTNTTYTFAEGSTNGAFSVTPSGGSAQSVPIHGLGDRAYDSTNYLPLSGGTMTGQISGYGGGGKYNVARDNASVKKDVNTSVSSSTYYPALDVKTKLGDWSIASLVEANSNNEFLHFCHVLDSDYTNNQNKARRYRLYAGATAGDTTQAYIGYVTGSPTSGNVIVADGSYGGMKTSGMAWDATNSTLSIGDSSTDGSIKLYRATGSATLQSSAFAGVNSTITLPANSGTVALTSQLPTYEDVTVTTGSTGFANIISNAPIAKTISAQVISPVRASCELWLNNADDTGYYAYVYTRGPSPSAIASQSVKIRIWKMP